MTIDVDSLYNKLVFGAGESINIFSTPIWERHAQDKGVPPIFQVVPEADRRLRLRHLYMLPSKKDESVVRNDLQLFRVMGFNARFLFGHSRRDYLLVDGNDAIVCDYSKNPPELKYYNKSASYIVNYLGKHFEKLWDLSEDKSERRTVLYDKELDFVLLHDSVASLVSIANKECGPIIEKLATKPELLYSISARQFEELIAELFRREGYSVSLTSVSRDGGKDILISTNTSAGDHLYLVECKRYSPQNPVGVSIIREMYGTLSQSNATAGIVVTTSYFTKDALAFRESIKWKMGLRDFDDLSAWLYAIQAKIGK